MTGIYASRSTADSAARRTLRQIHGKQFQPKSKVDFIVMWRLGAPGWTFEIINDAAHRADAAERASARLVPVA